MTTSNTNSDAEARGEYWRERISEQERSGKSVAQFCKEQSLTEQSFYAWRKRLGKPESMRFALVETVATQSMATEPVLELVLTTGERLRFSAGVDGTELRRVLAAVRA